MHDAEHSLFDEAHPPGIGLLEDRVNIGARTDNMRMEVSDLTTFHPQWIHFKLSENPEYRARFADRAWKHLTGQGAFTPDQVLERINKRISEVETAIIAESARWGDAKTSGGFAYTKNDFWIPEINKIRDKFIPFRTDIVIGQLKNAGLFPDVGAPVINDPAGAITRPEYFLEQPVAIRIETRTPQEPFTIPRWKRSEKDRRRCRYRQRFLLTM
jgi:hypothetical protein